MTILYSVPLIYRLHVPVRQEKIKENLSNDVMLLSYLHFSSTCTCNFILEHRIELMLWFWGLNPGPVHATQVFYY